MADFDLSRAVSEHRDLMMRLQNIRDSLSHDVIDYYYDDPTDEDNDRAKRDGIRDYLRRIMNDMQALLDGPLY